MCAFSLVLLSIETVRERPANDCDHGFERSGLSAEITIIVNYLCAFLLVHT